MQNSCILLIIIIDNIRLTKLPSAISNQVIFFPFFFLAILLLLHLSIFVVSGVKSLKQYPISILNVTWLFNLFTYILIGGLSATVSMYFDDTLEIVLNICYRVWSATFKFFFPCWAWQFKWGFFFKVFYVFLCIIHTNIWWSNIFITPF